MRSGHHLGGGPSKKRGGGEKPALSGSSPFLTQWDNNGFLVGPLRGWGSRRREKGARRKEGGTATYELRS